MRINELIQPTSIEEAYALLQEHEDAKIAGGTLWMRLGQHDVERLIVLDGLGLDTITETNDDISIGAMVTLRQLETNPIIQTHLNGMLSRAAGSIMGVQVRNLATIGGSVIGNYSFSDIIPVLAVMDTTLVFHHQGEVPLDLFLSKRLSEPDILVAIRIRKQEGRGTVHKISRTELDFALLNVAVTHTDRWRIAIGSRPAGAAMATNAMAHLDQADRIDDQTIATAVELAMEEIKLSSNAKASQAYRRDLLSAHLRRALNEVK